jgi:hypothetical protein
LNIIVQQVEQLHQAHVGYRSRDVERRRRYALRRSSTMLRLGLRAGLDSCT